MINLLQEYNSTFRVYFEDTDLMGIVYHAHYLKFFERARTEMLRSCGLSLSIMARSDTHFAIHNVNIIYKYPARLDDILNIKTLCANKRSCSFDFEQSMCNQLGQLICEAKIKVVCVDDNLKPKAMPGDMFLIKN